MKYAGDSNFVVFYIVLDPFDLPVFQVTDVTPMTQCQFTDPEEYGWKGDTKSFNILGDNHNEQNKQNPVHRLCNMHWTLTLH